MSYVVLARQWRPKQFDELLGQEHVSTTLKNAIEQDRVAHAFLFCGPRGVGKTSAARILAKVLICSKSKHGKSCNECSQCGEISKGTSMDVIEIDGASNNGVDSIRELREKAYYLPTQGKYKIYIIDEVHMLSQSAFNALLKILEEPPLHLKFIFATTEPHKIPATILSRCQRFDFKKITLKMLESHLEHISKKEGISFDAQALLRIAKEAQGSFRDALSLMDQAISFSGKNVTLKTVEELLGAGNDEDVFKLLGYAFRQEGDQLLKSLAKLYAENQDVKQLAAKLLEHLRSLLYVKLCSAEVLEKENPLDLTDHEKSALQNLAKLASIEEIEQAFHVVLKGTQDMAQTHYPQFVFEAMVIKLLEGRSLTSLAQVLEHVESLQGNKPVVKTQTVLGTSNGSENWGDLVRFIKAKKPSLAAILEHAYLVQWAQQKIMVGFPKDSVFSKLLSEKENVSSFEKIASEFTGSSLSLLLTDISETSDGTITNLAGDQESKMNGLKKMAMEHAIVQEAQKVFDGKVIDVRVQKNGERNKHE